MDGSTGNIEREIKCKELNVFLVSTNGNEKDLFIVINIQTRQSRLSIHANVVVSKG